MEKGMKGAAFAIFALACALLLVLGIGVAYAASGNTDAACSVFPELSLEKGAISSGPGRVATVKISVKGMQGQSCGLQAYGVDFTNGFDGKDFVLAIKGSQERNLFYLKPGETKTFEGLVGIPPETAAKNYTLQVTAYPESDHWKQASKNFDLEVGAQDAADAYWSTQLQIGWNLVPNAPYLGIYGCPDINTGYRYSAYKGDYITLNRYGAVFSVAPFEQDVANENYGGLFVFSTKRCTLESRVPSDTLRDAQVSLRDGQLLSIPPAWNGQTAGKLVQSCMEQSKNPSDAVELKAWDANNQKWTSLPLNQQLKNGEVVRALANFDCTLSLENRVN